MRVVRNVSGLHFQVVCGNPLSVATTTPEATGPVVCGLLHSVSTLYCAT